MAYRPPPLAELLTQIERVRAEMAALVVAAERARTRRERRRVGLAYLRAHKRLVSLEIDAAIAARKERYE